MFFVPFGGAKVSCRRVSCKAFGNYFRNIFALCLKVALLRRVLGGFGGDRCGFEGFCSVVEGARCFCCWCFDGGFLSVGCDGIVWGVAFGN